MHEQFSIRNFETEDYCDTITQWKFVFILRLFFCRRRKKKMIGKTFESFECGMFSVGTCVMCIIKFSQFIRHSRRRSVPCVRKELVYSSLFSLPLSFFFGSHLYFRYSKSRLLAARVTLLGVTSNLTFVWCFLRGIFVFQFVNVFEF